MANRGWVTCCKGWCRELLADAGMINSAKKAGCVLMQMDTKRTKEEDKQLGLKAGAVFVL